MNFNNWFNYFVNGNNVYSALVPSSSANSPLSNELGKSFRKSSLYQSSSAKWMAVKNGTATVNLSLLRELKLAIDNLNPSQKDVEILYKSVLDHLWNTLSLQNPYIEKLEQGLFLKLLQDNLQEDALASVAVGVLNNDKTELTTQKTNLFLYKLKEKNIKVSPYLPTLYKIKPLLLTTREIWTRLKANHKKQPSLSDRKRLLEKLFTRLETTIHNIAHNGDCDMNIVGITGFHQNVCLARELAKTNKKAKKFVAEAEDIIKTSTATDEEARRVENLYKKYKNLLPEIMMSISKVDRDRLGKEVKESQITSYRRYHQFVIPISFKDKRKEHLSSVYNLSVGLSILKEVMNSYTGNLPTYLRENYSKLRRERNYLAHGDEMRDVAGITSLYIHFELLPLVHEIKEEIANL